MLRFGPLRPPAAAPPPAEVSPCIRHRVPARSTVVRRCFLAFAASLPGVSALAQDVEGGDRRLMIGPVAGLTTEWREAPESTSIPLTRTVRFRQHAPADAVVQWFGATEVRRTNTASIATCAMSQAGHYRVQTLVRTRDGTLRHECSLRAVDFDPARIEVTPLPPSVDTLDLDDSASNAETMAAFFGGSIQDLREIGPGAYRTSVNREVSFAVDVRPADFAPLIEWRVDGVAPPPPDGDEGLSASGYENPGHPGRSIFRHSFERVRVHRVDCGPPGAPHSCKLETFRVRLKAPKGPIRDGEAITYACETNPPGYEDEVVWLSSTKYGRAFPVTGVGRTFTVEFENTFRDGVRWAGVRGGNRGDNIDQYCYIFLDEWIGPRRTTPGDFALQKNPKEDGRIFLDTFKDQEILEAPSIQAIQIDVDLLVLGFDPDDLEVLWEVRDPDDKATHPVLDANGANGGDNYDRTPADLEDDFFFEADHAIRCVSTPGSDPSMPDRVIGTARTEIDPQWHSSVLFCYGDEGGDNYVITAVCVFKDKDDPARHDEDTTAELTVWRKRFAVAHAMKKQNDDVQSEPFGSSPGANRVCVTAGPNGVSDTMLLGGDDQRVGETVTTGANGTVETHANSGGDRLYPSEAGTLAGLQAALHTSYANVTDWDHAAYIDFVARDGNLCLPHDPQINQRNLEWTEYLHDNLHGGGDGHADNTYGVIGITDFTNVRGSARVRPHIGLGVQFIRTHTDPSNQLTVDGTVIHELGHALLPDGIDSHDGHTSGDDDPDCCFEQSIKGAHGLEICEAHCRLLRENVTQSWPDHDRTIIDAPESGRDSDD